MNYEEIFPLTAETVNEARAKGYKSIVHICNTGDAFAIDQNIIDCLKSIALDTDNEYNEYDETQNEWFSLYGINEPELLDILEDE